MRTCSVCDREITPAMVRHGGALTRGGDYLHRECRGASDQSRPRARQPVARSVSGAQAEPGVQAVAVEVEYASFWRRFAANLIDGVILNALAFAIAIPLGLATVLRGAAAPEGLGSILGSLLLMAVPIAYTLAYWMRRGATPGKAAVGIRVVNTDDGPPSGTQSFVRYLGYILSSIPFCLGYAWMLFDREKRCWHDILSGTRVIRA